MEKFFQRDVVTAEIIANGNGPQTVDTNRNYNIGTLKPERVLIPHSWHNIIGGYDRIQFYNNVADPEGSLLATLDLGDSNRDLDSLAAAIIDILNFAGGITATVSLDYNYRLKIVTDAAVGIHYERSTASRYLGILENSFGVESPPGTWTITGQRSINLIWPRAMYMRINDNYYLIPTTAPFGEYMTFNFPDNENVTNPYQSNQFDVELTDQDYSPINLRGYNWFLQVLVSGKLR